MSLRYSRRRAYFNDYEMECCCHHYCSRDCRTSAKTIQRTIGFLNLHRWKSDKNRIW
ncbi:hypothetical protein MPTK1_5g23960 [Marchantia polymorpha subsp. ruderalis]|uniref:Uncharacterized protein n=2 Tax=Marchantia polymorpha TaxID=3197 RepID=A0AAF6BLN2_MARPO|nr:hypothetical protein MARPO_0010s0060 [Marchantia polymorpha]BBN12916.1 hypothetical protein Mp_5g23960 [Marchantia polymorpha subsp. ruderalis]|eukprot:PTQ46655.1 hypothetical protein MARPO_0010s0060 [Marchantia polymorpha]